MFSKLKSGFNPHGIVSSKYECDGVRYETTNMSAAIAGQLKLNREYRLRNEEIQQIQQPEPESLQKMLGLNTMTKTKLTSFAEIVLTEMLYYNQLNEIGSFLASAYNNEEAQSKENNEPVDQLSATMLIASTRVRQKLTQLTELVDISYTLLAPASYALNPETNRSTYGILLSIIHVKLGGNSYDADNDEPSVALRREVVSMLCEISEYTWGIMNLCRMMNVFRYLPDIGTSRLFDTVSLLPSESVFGNNGWRPLLKVADK